MFLTLIIIAQHLHAMAPGQRRQSALTEGNVLEHNRKHLRGLQEPASYDEELDFAPPQGHEEQPALQKAYKGLLREDRLTDFHLNRKYRDPQNREHHAKRQEAPRETKESGICNASTICILSVFAGCSACAYYYATHNHQA